MGASGTVGHNQGPEPPLDTNLSCVGGVAAVYVAIFVWTIEPAASRRRAAFNQNFEDPTLYGKETTTNKRRENRTGTTTHRTTTKEPTTAKVDGTKNQILLKKLVDAPDTD